MSSKPKLSGCGVCREVKDAAAARGQTLLTFFIEAHRQSSSSKDHDTLGSVIAERVHAFEAFCETGIGSYEVPKCVLAHVRGGATNPAYRGPKRRYDDARPKRHMLRVGAR